MLYISSIALRTIYVLVLCMCFFSSLLYVIFGIAYTNLASRHSRRWRTTRRNNEWTQEPENRKNIVMFCCRRDTNFEALLPDFAQCAALKNTFISFAMLPLNAADVFICTLFHTLVELCFVARLYCYDFLHLKNHFLDMVAIFQA